GQRHILNYGHTLGHAIETASGYQVKHGQAVAIGMVFAAGISNQMEFLSDAEVSRLRDLIARVGLPTGLPRLDVDAVARALRHDKKIQTQKIRFVLLESIGKAFVLEGVSPDLVQQVVSG
ncbi:MAG: 3-dehydroquinate synthase, partial [Chloroflexi bacterium]|nr:3-dehydroquinate synthase [Chloroflexota bacterium]